VQVQVHIINTNDKSSIHTLWFFITLGHKSTTVLTYSERIGMQYY